MVKADTKQILYTIKYRRGQNYDCTKSIYEQDFAEHRRYMQKLFDNGKLVLAGPFIDNSGGQIIIKVDSEDEAINTMQNDPGVLKDIFIGELHPWYIVARNTEFEAFSLRKEKFSNEP